MPAIQTPVLRSLALLGCIAFLGGCLGGGSEPASAGAPANGGLTPASNQTPSIDGVPPTTATVDEAYRFQPDAADLDGDTLSFRIANKPDWAAFDEASGELLGTPEAGDVGTYEDVQISVTDGTATQSLAAFDITVTAQATGQVSLSWTAPTQNADGTALTNLAGYKIYYGRSADELSTVRKLGVNVTSVVIENLSPGTWFFAMTSFNSANVESARTATVSKMI